jgi:hypothetical protein
VFRATAYARRELTVDLPPAWSVQKTAISALSPGNGRRFISRKEWPAPLTDQNVQAKIEYLDIRGHP